MTCLLVMGVSLMACQKEEASESVSYNSPETKKNLATIQDKSSGQESRLIFSSLSSQEKSDVWRYHLQASKNNLNLSAQQQEFIDEIIAFTKPEFYDNSEKMTPQVRAFEKRAEALFDMETRIMILADLRFTPQEIDNPGIQGKGQEALIDCQCSLKDDWCGTLNFTTLWQCRPIKCKRGSGCGFLWGYLCGGRCVRVA